MTRAHLPEYPRDDRHDEIVACYIAHPDGDEYAHSRIYAALMAMEPRPTRAELDRAHAIARPLMDAILRVRARERPSEVDDLSPLEVLRLVARLEVVVAEGAVGEAATILHRLDRASRVTRHPDLRDIMHSQMDRFGHERYAA